MAVTSGPIVERVDVVRDVRDRELSVLVDLLLDSLFFQAAEEGLSDRIVPTVALAAHAGLEMIRPTEATPRIAAELGPLIGVNQRPAAVADAAPPSARHSAPTRDGLLVWLPTPRSDARTDP